MPREEAANLARIISKRPQTHSPVIILRQKPHKTRFKREADLYLSIVIQTHPDLATLMALLGFGLRTTLGGIFLVSGTGKLWDLPGTRQALSDFGVPDALTLRGAKSFPMLEILVGLGLFFDATYRPAALGAIVLSTLFILGIANLLRQGRTPPCHCFGAIQSAPVGIRTLIRAFFLLALSILCFCIPDSCLTPDAPSRIISSAIALLIGSVASNVALWNKLQERNQHKRLDAGQRLPALKLLDDKWLNDKLEPGLPNLLILTTPECKVCQQIKDNLERWVKTVAGDLRMLELSALAPHSDPPQPTNNKCYFRDTEMGLLARGTPSAILVDSHGVILAPPALGPEQTEALLRVALAKKP